MIQDIVYSYVPYEKLVSNIFFLCLGYWLVAFFLYLVRLFDEGFSKATAYGKLAPVTTKTTTQKDESSSSSTETEEKSKFIVTKNAWSIFYLTLSILSTFYLFLLCTQFEQNLYNQKVLYVLLIIQGLRRFYETVKIQNHRYSEMSFFLFVSGLSYYVFLTSSIYFETLFKDMHGTINESTNSLEKRNILKILVTVVIFSLNSFEQYKSHKILASLRSNNSNDSSTTPIYRIPYGRLFNSVSSPHYLNEVLIYLSFLLLTYFNYYSLLLCFVFTFVNLLHRASETHEWYQAKFKEYPKSRNIMIPGLI